MASECHPSGICEECHDGFFGLEASNAFGCTPCGCDVGGTEPGYLCDKVTGECTCRPGIVGRQ